MHDPLEIRETLLAIENDLARAWVNGDRKFIDRVLSDDWRVIDLTGRVLTKADVIKEAFGSNERKVLAMEITEVESRVFDGWAIVNGKTRAAGEYQGQVMEVQLRFTDIFVLRETAWQIVASQATLLQQTT